MSRVIDATRGGRCQRWDIPELGDASVAQPAAGDPVAVERVARDEGFEQGYREGLEAGRQAQQARVEQLEQLMRTLARPLEELDQKVEADLVALALGIARQLLYREYAAQPERIADVVREALELLPSAARVVSLRLHPEDAVLVRELVQTPAVTADWQIVEDPALTRGGCMVDTDTLRVDATMEARLDAVIATLMDDESNCRAAI